MGWEFIRGWKTGVKRRPREGREPEREGLRREGEGSTPVGGPVTPVRKSENLGDRRGLRLVKVGARGGVSSEDTVPEGRVESRVTDAGHQVVTPLFLKSEGQPPQDLPDVACQVPAHRAG